jgi:cell division protein FtsL
MARASAGAVATPRAPKRAASGRPAAAKRPAARRSGHASTQVRTTRRASGYARGGAVALPLPARVLNAPVTRVLRGQGGRTLDALLAGRGWIVLVGALLAGIVFFNVDLLKLNRDIASTAEQIEQFKRENGRLRERVAHAASSERIQEAAALQGLVLPAPGEVRYLKAHPNGDPQMAVKRYSEPSGLFTAPAPVASVPTPSSGVTPDATATAGVDPAATTAPVTPTTSTTTPTTTLTPTTGTTTTGAPTTTGTTTQTATPGTTATGTSTGTAVAPTG